MKTRYIFILAALLLVAAPTRGLTQAPITRGVLKEKRVHFSRGKAKASGKVDNSTSYSYRVRAKKDQQMEVSISPTGGATFSIVGPAALPNAAGVSNWSGALPQDGDYSIVVAVSARVTQKVPFQLEVALK